MEIDFSIAPVHMARFSVSSSYVPSALSASFLASESHLVIYDSVAGMICETLSFLCVVFVWFVFGFL